MRWQCLLVMIGLSLPGVSCWSQELSSAERLGKLTSGVVKFQMVQGRIGLDASRHRKGSQMAETPGHFESIRVTADRGIPSLQYICRTSQQHLVIHLSAATSLVLESYLPIQDTRCVLTQPSRGLIEWKITTRDLSQERRTQKFFSTTLVGLRLHDPSRFDEHFGVVIQRMLPDRSLGEFSDRVRNEVIKMAETSQPLAESSMEKWIDELGHRRHSVRTAAHRNLVFCGVSILPSIEQRIASESTKPLDPEQRMRLERIMRQLQPPQRDDARSLARRLVRDRCYWSAIAKDLTTAQHAIATNHLNRQGIDLPEFGKAQPNVRIADSVKSRDGSLRL